MSRRFIQIGLMSIALVMILAFTMPGIILGGSAEQATDPTTILKEPTVTIEVDGVEYDLVEGLVIENGADKASFIHVRGDSTTYGAGSIEIGTSADGKDLIVKEVSFSRSEGERPTPP